MTGGRPASSWCGPRLETLPSASLLRRDIGSLLGGTVTKVSRTLPPPRALRCAPSTGSGPPGDYQYGEALYVETDEARGLGDGHRQDGRRGEADG